MSNYVKEANACYERAEKALKTGLLKWTPEYEIAANEYAKAASSFRSAKMCDKFIEASIKAAECYEKSRSFFSAAKTYEQVGLSHKEKGDWDQMIVCFERACLYFREHGVPDTAALTFNRGAGMLETVKPEKSAEWYGMASEVTLLEDRYLQAAEYANKAMRMYLKLKLIENAIQWAQTALQHYVAGAEPRQAGRQTVVLVILCIAKEDSVAAQKIFMANEGYVEQEEVNTINRLLRGLDDFDNLAVYQALSSPFIANLDNEITKIVRDLLVKYKPQKQDGIQSSGDAGHNEDDEAGAVL